MKEKRFNITAPFEKAPTLSQDGDIAYIEGWASRTYNDNGEYVVDYDGEIILSEGADVSRARVLLLAHNHNEPIGKIQLEARPQGIYCRAEVHKEMHPKAFYGVKNGIYTQFSIGFMAQEYEFKKINGEDYVAFSKLVVIENSLVAIGANPLADITSVKSVIQDGKCIGLQCSIEAMKAMNPDCGCELETEEKSLEGEAMEETIDKSISEQDIKEKSTEVETETPTEVTEEQPTTEAEESTSEGQDVDDKQATEEGSEVDDTDGQVEEVKQEVEQEAETEEVATEVTEEVKPKYSIEEVIGYLSTVNIEDLDEVQVEALYNATAGRIEALVDEAIKA